MAAGSALKKINARVKQLAKKFPKKKRVSLQKQAGAEYRAGKLKAKRKRAAPIKRAKKRASPRKRKRVVAKKRTVTTRRAAPRRRRRVSGIKARGAVQVGAVRKTRRRRRKSAPKRVARRRVSGISGKSTNMLLIGGLALGAIYLMTRKPQTVYVPTGNVAKDTKAQQILSYISQAGASAAQIAAAISALQNRSEAQLDQDINAVNSGRLNDVSYWPYA